MLTREAFITEERTLTSVPYQNKKKLLLVLAPGITREENYSKHKTNFMQYELRTTMEFYRENQPFLQKKIHHLSNGYKLLVFSWLPTHKI